MAYVFDLVFQFHYGSIKIKIIVRNLNEKESFNSTMVRLKSRDYFKNRCFFLCFNSTMVRLKYGALKNILLPNICFNSTMVRLKFDQLLFKPETLLMFQFHYGSIKIRLFVFCLRCKVVSIPLWFD